MRALTLAVLALSLIASSPGARLQGAPLVQERRHPAFPSVVNVIRLDVSVVDRQGRPFQGLRAEDFEITEDGRRAEITFFEAIEALGELDPAAGRSVGPARQRMLLLVDAAAMSPAQLRRARESVARYVREVAADGDWVRLVNLATGRAIDGRIPTDRAFLASAARAMVRGSVLWASAGLLGDPIQDRVEFDASPEEVPRHGLEGLDPSLGLPSEARTSGQFLSLFAQSSGLLGALESLLVQLQGVEGRKAVVLISPGFPQLRDLDRRLQQVASVAREARAAIYFVDSVALDGLLPERAGQRVRPVFERAWARSGGAQDLAEATGGFTSRFDNSLWPALARVADEMRTYYVLGYVPGGPADGRFRSVNVRVAVPGLTVRTKKGYLATARR